MNTVQDDVWSILGVLAVGIVPLLLMLLFFKPRAFRRRPGGASEAYKEALFEGEECLSVSKPEADDELLTGWLKVYYVAGVIVLGFVSSVVAIMVMNFVRKF